MGNVRDHALIRDTQAIWHAQYATPLSDDDATQILVNVTDFFNLLHEWDRQSNAAHNTAHAA